MKVGGVNVLSTAPQFARIAQEMTAQDFHEGDGALVVPTHFYNPALPGQLRQLADFIGGCGAGRFYMCLEPNGDMYPCVFFPHVAAMRVGNIFKDNFEQVWRRSELFWQIRNKDNLREHCGTCRYRYTCGGCRARAYNYFHDILAPDPGCILNKEAWDRVAPKSK
jgi:radical SAM protein with 4Fe4S-binding SPASM domain